MELRAAVRVTIPFHDIDILEVAWHGHYLKYFELARTELMQKYELDWPRLRQEGVAMPVVEVHVQYRRPLLYGTEVWVEATIEEYSYPELKVHYAIRQGAARSLMATGWTRQIYYAIATKETLFEVPPFVLGSFTSAREV